MRNDNYSVSKVYDVFRLIQSFNESNVTFTNQPATFLIPSANFTIGSELNTFIRIDVTDLIRDWYNGEHPNYGLQLRADDETLSSLVAFYSSNYSNENYYPRLEVTLEEPVQISSRNFSYVKENSLITTDGYKYSQNYDVSEVSQYTFFVNNLGPINACNAFMQVSPDAMSWCIDSALYTIMPGELKPVIPKTFSRYARIGYQSTTAGNSTSIDIHLQMQN